MAKKQFKAESKKMLDLMIHSIYTNRDIFLRELISNASDALDKRYYQDLTSGTSGVTRKDYRIDLITEKEAGTLLVRDNGIGMDKDELDKNLGTIAKSGSEAFRAQLEQAENQDAADSSAAKKAGEAIIGQFGVGFYSAFMVADKINVVSRREGSEEAWRWQSSGADGYTITEAEKDGTGTDITLHLKADTDTEKYSEYLEDYRLQALVKKYSDYISYPIYLNNGAEPLNSMEPIWKKQKSKVKPEEYASYYKERFSDYEDPARVIRTSVEGVSSYTALLFIPKHAPFDYYDAKYEKGLALYSSGVLIMEKCKDLVSDHFNFVRGLVDTQDLSLNISRETLQQDRQLKNIAKNLDKKIKKELAAFLKEDREGYESFFKSFGSRLKYGIYESYGADKDLLADLLIYYSSAQEKMVTLDEYLGALPEGQDEILYAAGETVEKIDMLPQVRAAKADGKDILYLTDEIDEFVMKVMDSYKEKKFRSVTEIDDAQGTDKESADAAQTKPEDQAVLDFVKDMLGGAVSEVRFSTGLNDAPAALANKGDISIEMEKTIRRMPIQSGMTIERILTLNPDHPAVKAMIGSYGEGTDDHGRETAARDARLLYDQAVLLSGLELDDPLRMSRDICDLITSN